MGHWIAITTLIWLAALPLVMHRYQLVSPIALLLNPVIWLPMSIALFAGFGVLVFGGILPPVAAVCGWICNANLAVLEQAVAWAKQMPGGYFWTPAPAIWWMIGFYGSWPCWPRCPAAGCRGVGGWRWWRSGGRSVPPSPSPRPETRRRLTATFAAVGHGACTIIQLPDGRTLLFDAGGMGTPSPVVRAVSSCLWSQGITHLDAVILSHGDADHYNAVPGLLERFTIGVVYVSPMMFDQPSIPLQALRERLEYRQIPIRELRAGDRLAAGDGVAIEVWHPAVVDASRSDNANSLVLSVEYAGTAMLLTADIETPGLEDLLAEQPARGILSRRLITAPDCSSKSPSPTGRGPSGSFSAAPIRTPSSRPKRNTPREALDPAHGPRQPAHNQPLAGNAWKTRAEKYGWGHE
jgi:competence protein ComEC